MALPYDNTQTYFTAVDGITKNTGESGTGNEGGDNLIEVTGTGTGRTVREVTGTYVQGVGENDRFFPPEIEIAVDAGGYLRIGNTTATTLINFGNPETTDGLDAKIDRSNWVTNDAGLVQVAKRGSITNRYNAAPGGNGSANINIIRGNGTIVNLIGMDLNIFTNTRAAGNGSGNNQFSHLHFGGSGLTPDNSEIGLYNVRVRGLQAGAANIDNFRCKFYSNNLTMDGFEIDFRGLTTGTIEMTANAFPDFVRGLVVFDDFTSSAGDKVRQMVILDAGSSFDQTLTGVNLRNVSIHGGQSTSTLRLLDPLFNTVKAFDSNSETNTRRGLLIGERTLKGQVLLDGTAPTTIPGFQMTQLQSDANQEFRYSLSGGVYSFNFNSGTPVSASTNLTLTNPVSAVGALSARLEQYRFLHESSTQRRVQLRNKYRWAICEFGYVPFVSNNFYLGGQLSALADEPEYFGMISTTGRTEYDVTGLDQGNIDLAEDVVVAANTFTEAQYTDTYQVTNWDDLYVAFHNFACQRDDVGMKGNTAVSAAVANSILIGDNTIQINAALLTPSANEIRVGPILFNTSTNIYRAQSTSTFGETTGGIDTITKRGEIRLAESKQDGLNFKGVTSAAADELSLNDVFTTTDTPNLANSGFKDCDFDNVEIIVDSPITNATRYIRFDNCTGNPKITATGTGDVVVYNPPSDTTFDNVGSGTLTTRAFVSFTVEYDTEFDSGDFQSVRWASSVDAANLDTPGTFQNDGTGFSRTNSGNNVTWTFDVPATDAGVSFNVFATLWRDNFYEIAIVGQNTDATLATEAIPKTALDIGAFPSPTDYTLTTGLFLLNINVTLPADDTDKIKANLTGTEGGNVNSGWTTMLARAAIREGIQRSQQYSEGVARGRIPVKFITWTTTQMVLSEADRLEYTHSSSNNIYQPQGRITLAADGSDLWRTISSLQTDTNITFDPDAAGAKGPEIQGLLDEVVLDLQGDNKTATLKRLLQKVNGLYSKS